MAIADCGSLSAAAQRIGIAQPSLTQHLAAMERELGLPLVVRSPRGSTLTNAGMTLLGHARTITDNLDLCLSDMRALTSDTAGHVRFGMPPSVSMVMSVPLAETVRIDLPDIRLRVSEAMSGFIKTWIDDKTVEIGFLYDLTGVGHLDATHVLNERLFFFSAPDNWPLDTPPGAPVRLAALAGVDLVLPGDPHGLRRIIAQAAADHGVTLTVVTELDAMTQIKELVARGSGHSIFAPAACHDLVQSGRLISAPIIDPVISRPVYLVRNPAFGQTRACAAIAAATLRVAAEMVHRNIWEGDLVWSVP